MTRVKLTERVETGKIWKSPRAKEKVIVAAFNPYEGRNLFDLREHVIGADDIMRPSPRGIAMVVEKLPELAGIVNAALRKAIERGLLADDGAGE
jgi:Transcriptional Coactivator p15 (PC4)